MVLQFHLCLVVSLLPSFISILPCFSVYTVVSVHAKTEWHSVLTVSLGNHILNLQHNALSYITYMSQYRKVNCGAI